MSLQPNRSETFKLLIDSRFVDNVGDIVGFYVDPPDRALVRCIDTHDYKRQGTTSAGPRHRRAEYPLTSASTSSWTTDLTDRALIRDWFAKLPLEFIPPTQE